MRRKGYGDALPIDNADSQQNKTQKQDNMLGFDVSVKGKSISAAIPRGVLTAILTNRNMQDVDEITLNIAGLNLEAGMDTLWLRQEELKEGDEIVIKIMGIAEVTTPAEKKELDKAAIKKARLQSYYDLKRELELDGLI